MSALAEYNKKFVQKIRQYYREGIDREEIFKRICSETKMAQPTVQQIERWIATMDIASSSKKPSKHYDLLQKITEEFDNMQNVVTAWKYNLISDKFHFLDSRYALSTEGTSEKEDLYFVDCLYAKRKKLKLEGSFPVLFDIIYYSFFVINMQYVMLCDKKQRLMSDKCIVMLLRLDLKNLRCTLIDLQKLKCRFSNCLFDCTDRQNFYIQGYNPANKSPCLLRGTVKNGYLEFAQHFVCFDHPLSCERLEGNRLQTFTTVQALNDRKIKKDVFGEHSLMPVQKNTNFHHLFDKQMPEGMEDLKIVCHLWLNTKCYLVCRRPNEYYHTILIFDLEIQEIIPTSCIFHTADRAIELFVDEEEQSATLFMRANSNYSFPYFNRKFKLNGEPETLINLCLFKLRRDAIFNKNKAYKKILDKFPNRLKPSPIQFNNMDVAFWSKMSLGQKIRCCHREGLTQKETFNRIQAEMNLPQPSNEELNQWFETVNNPVDPKEPVNYAHHILLQRIMEESSKMQNVIAEWEREDVCYSMFQFLDSRYALSYSGYDKQTSLCLLDNYHGKKLKLQLDGQFPEDFQLSGYILSIVDTNYILLCEKKRLDNPSYHILLLQLDLSNFKCTLLDSKHRQFHFHKCLFDYRNPHTFYIYYNEDERDTFCLQAAKIGNEKLEISEQHVDFNYQFNCARISGNNLQTFTTATNENPANDEDEWKDVFGEYSLLPDQLNINVRQLFDQRMPENMMFTCHFWRGENCYIIGRYFKTPHHVVLILNTETRDITPTTCTFYTNDSTITMFVDEEEETVTVCMKNQNDKAHTFLIRRFRLNEPESLTNMSLFKLRRDELFHEGNLYNKVTEMLPNKLKSLNT